MQWRKNYKYVDCKENMQRSLRERVYEGLKNAYSSLSREAKKYLAVGLIGLGSCFVQSPQPSSSSGSGSSGSSSGGSVTTHHSGSSGSSGSSGGSHQVYDWGSMSFDLNSWLNGLPAGIGRFDFFTTRAPEIASYSYYLASAHPGGSSIDDLLVRAELENGWDMIVDFDLHHGVPVSVLGQGPETNGDFVSYADYFGNSATIWHVDSSGSVSSTNVPNPFGSRSFTYSASSPGEFCSFLHGLESALCGSERTSSGEAFFNAFFSSNRGKELAHSLLCTGFLADISNCSDIRSYFNQDNGLPVRPLPEDSTAGEIRDFLVSQGFPVGSGSFGGTSGTSGTSGTGSSGSSGGCPSNVRELYDLVVQAIRQNSTCEETRTCAEFNDDLHEIYREDQEDIRLLGITNFDEFVDFFIERFNDPLMQPAIQNIAELACEP